MNFFKLSRDPMLITWWKGYITLRMGAPHFTSTPCLFWWPWVFCRWQYNLFNLSRDLKLQPHWGVLRIYALELVAVCHHPDMFYDHKHRDSGSMFLLVTWSLVNTCLNCQVNLCVEVPHGEHHLTVFGGHWSIVVGYMKYLTCHVFSKNHETEGSSNLFSGSSSCYVTTLPSWMAKRIVEGEIMFLVCHVIKQGHVIKGSIDYNDRSPSR